MSIAVVFPGQGSQKVGMGKDFYDNFDQAKAFFQKADESLGYSLSSIIFEGPEEDLRLTQNTQPALVTVSAAIWSVIADKVKADYFAGHSLGEYSAVYAGGGMSFEDAVVAVHNRGKFMQSAVPVGVGAMAAVLGLSDEDVVEVCQAHSKEGAICEPANFNCNGQVVIAGHAEAVAAIAEPLKAKGAKRVVPLPVSAPFHCSLMEPAKANMADYLANITISDLQTPIFNNVDAIKETTADEVRDALIRQVAGAVKWTESVKNMVAAGVDTIIEVGAGSVLTGLVKKIDANVKCISISTVDDLEKL